MESEIFHITKTIKRFVMIETNFNLEQDLEKLNLTPVQKEEIKFLLKTYLDEMNYWKTKHESLQKKIQNIVCY